MSEDLRALLLHKRAWGGHGQDQGGDRGAYCWPCSQVVQDYVPWPCPALVPDDECPHDAYSGDEGPARDLLGGIVVRWRCDGCGRIRYDDDALLRLRGALVGRPS